MTKTGKPTELHVFALDGVLYNSQPPLYAPSSWWLSAHSLAGHGKPGFDTKWILDGVVEARRSILLPTARTALLSGRPQHTEMSKSIQNLLQFADLRFDYVQLKPVSLQLDIPAYKAWMVQQWIAAEPTIASVMVHDKDAASVRAIEAVVQRSGRAFVAPGFLPASASPG
jgi:hypothetical protein